MRRLLSPHEIATLIILLSAPGHAAVAAAETAALESDSLVETVRVEAGARQCVTRVTPQGREVLRRLGVV
jgi:DNA-binding MarR family transcriptional regulator